MSNATTTAPPPASPDGIFVVLPNVSYSTPASVRRLVRSVVACRPPAGRTRRRCLRPTPAMVRSTPQRFRATHASAVLYPGTMAAVEWILVLALMVPAVLCCWALLKSGELQTVASRLRVLRPAARRRVWTTLLVTAVVGTAVGAAIVWAFSTGHITLGLAVLIGLVVLNGVVTPLLRTRRNHRKSASACSEASKPR